MQSGTKLGGTGVIYVSNYQQHATLQLPRSVGLNCSPGADVFRTPGGVEEIWTFTVVLSPCLFFPNKQSNYAFLSCKVNIQLGCSGGIRVVRFGSSVETLGQDTHLGRLVKMLSWTLTQNAQLKYLKYIFTLVVSCRFLILYSFYLYNQNLHLGKV